MTRITVRLDEHLLKEAKQLAAKTGRTLTAVIEGSLRETLARPPDQKPARRVKLTTYGSGWVEPGVDIDNSADLWDFLDEAEGRRARLQRGE